MSEQEKVTEDLKEAIREARGLLKDTRELIKNLVELNVYTRELVERKVDEEVYDVIKTELDKLLPQVRESLDKTCAKAVAHFDELIDVLNGVDKASIRAGKPPVATMIRTYATKLHQEPMILPKGQKKRDR